MKRLLLTVQDRFQISGRGLVVVPGPLLNEFPGEALVTAELHRPDGMSLAAQLSIEYYFSTPPPKERRWGCCFRSLNKDEVPIGTEVWVDSAES